MTIVLSPEIEEKLKEKASREGGDINRVADRLIASALDWETREQEEIVAGLRAADEAAVQGRIRSLEEVIRDKRAKYGFPESWPFGVEVEPE